MERQNIVSVSWGDHLTFGQDDGRLDNPDTVKRHMRRWQEDLGVSIVHWRLFRKHLKGSFRTASGYRHPSQVQVIDWDDLQIIPALAKEMGLKTVLVNEKREGEPDYWIKDITDISSLNL